jgi:ribonuclease VapC
VSEDEVVLDASALLAYFQDETGAEVVENAFQGRAHVSAVNWAEVLSKVAETDRSPADFSAQLQEEGILGPLLIVVPLDERGAEEIGRLRPLTRDLGLSLGDRACVALGRQLALPVLTADKRWADLSLDKPRIEVIR